MSGDPVAARLPFAFLTKMVTFVKWKRFEMNAAMKFHCITEAAFASVMRRSLVTLCKGWFVSTARLARLPPGAQGYFLMQEDMKDFVTSKPAAGVLFTILLGDLLQFSVDRFREKIESYADGGGDGGFTRGSMRLACGLGQELHAPGSTRGPAHAPGDGPGLNMEPQTGGGICWLQAGSFRRSERTGQNAAVSCFFDVTLPQCWAGPLLGVPGQQASTG